MITFLQENGLDLLQSVSIIAGFVFTFLALRREALARKTSSLFSVFENYTQIWIHIGSNPELMRVFRKDADLKEKAITGQERIVCKLLFLQLFTAYESQRLGNLTSLEGMKRDGQELLEYPIPRSIWEEIRPYQNIQFREFLER